jgi:antitoxin component YwqK of YwqJK toxin-antitoxin module
MYMEKNMVFIRVGIHKGWYENGNPSFEAYYVEGKKHGICKGWYENDNLEFESTFVEGIEHGTFKWWYEDGNLQYEELLVNGKTLLYRHGNCKYYTF